MAIYYKDDNMSVQNPLGVLNLNPLPDGLPSGLVRAHLTRRSLSAMRIDLVAGELTDLEEYVTTDEGDISYANISVSSTHRRAGWRDPTYAVDYDVGYTWMAVASYNDENFAVYAATENHNGGPTNEGEELSWRAGGVRLSARRDSGSTNSATVDLQTPPSGLFAGFGVLDRESSELRAYVPHVDQISSTSESEDTDTPPAVPGLVIGRASQGFASNNVQTEAEMAFFAAWDRPLSQSEMEEAYQLLKPWLARRGVSIA